MSDENNTWFLEKLRQRAEAAEARVSEYERILADPAAVWANMLTGKIARPQVLEHYEQCKARVEELEAGLKHYHKDAFCCCCGGVMHDSRDAICHVCSPEPEYVAAMQCIAQLEAERSATANLVLVEDERHDALLQAEAENDQLRARLEKAEQERRKQAEAVEWAAAKSGNMGSASLLRQYAAAIRRGEVTP